MANQPKFNTPCRFHLDNGRVNSLFSKSNTLIYTFLILLFLTATVIQLCYSFVLRYRSAFIIPPTTTEALPPVSIIICARNEASHLQQFLPFVLQQEYAGTWEVIVVNDGSTDSTQELLANWQKQYSQLRIVTITPDTVKDIPGKKYALAKGIAAARYDRLLLTDADCSPSSPQWLQHMVLSGKEIVLGYGAYITRPGLLNRFIRWETVHTCMQYAGYAAVGLPYMGVGRNLCYNKTLLPQLEQDTAFQAVYRSTPSGDDDLLIGRIAGQSNTSVCLNKTAHTVSAVPETWKAWWRQKTRHASTGKYYAPQIKTLLGLYGLSHSLYWLLGLPLCLYAILHPSFCSILLLSTFALRLLVSWTNALYWYRELGEKKISLFYPLGDLGWALYNVFLSPYILWKNKQAWK